MLFFGRKMRLIDHARAGRTGKLPESLVQALASVMNGSEGGPLQGLATDEVGVFRLSDELTLVQDVSFLAPAVNVPFMVGQIGAADALGRLYALGATPRTGLHLIGYPDDVDGFAAWLGEIARGGAERLQAAGAVTAGCHTVRDAELKFGFVVTGLIHPLKLITCAGARPGDKLVLTKSLGTGVTLAAHKVDACEDDLFQAASSSMIQLNDIARDAMLESGAHAASAIQGQGLAGHALKMANSSKVSIVLEVSQLPLLPGVEKLARKPYLTRAAAANASDVTGALRKEGKPDTVRLEFLYDPQFSGGLLISVAAADAEILLEKCRERGAQPATIIGEVVERQDVALIVHQ
jgi:selenide,water dikinase